MHFPPLPSDGRDRLREIRRRKALLYPDPNHFQVVPIPLSARRVNPLTFAMSETKLERVTRQFDSLFLY